MGLNFLDTFLLTVPGREDSRRAHTASDEIAHLREIRVRALFSRPCMARHFMLPSRTAFNTLVPHVIHSVSHLLCAVLALGSVTWNTKNSMFVTPVRARVTHAIVAHAGVGITPNFRVNIMDFPRIFASSARNMRIFPPEYITKNISGVAGKLTEKKAFTEHACTLGPNI